MGGIVGSHRFIARSASAAALALLLAACGGGAGTTASGGSNPPAPGPSGSGDTAAPALAITAPSSSGSFVATGATVALGGTASDNVGVTRVSWRNAATGGSGNASGTGNWSVASVALASGVNTITVTAFDAAG